MPVPQIGAVAPAIGGMASANPANPAATAAGGYSAALGSLNKSLKALQGGDQAAAMQLQQQLAQNQGKVQQGLINSGLGNTTVAQTMQQAPLQTYNMGMAKLQDQLAGQQSAIYEKGAGLQAQGGDMMAQLLQQQLMQQQQNANQTAQKQGPSVKYNGLGLI